VRGSGVDEPSPRVEYSADNNAVGCITASVPRSEEVTTGERV
jgi:hypothetical protein